jgi:predicted negative regulator of RcsB-dependent stress response
VYPIESIIADDEKADLVKVAVKIPKGAFTTLKMTRFLPEAGESVIVIGSPYGLEQTVSDGIVSTVREVTPGTRLIQITAPISPGSSGSPVMNEKGAVLGIATITFAAGQNLNFAVPSRKIVALRPGEPLVYTDWAALTYEKLGLKSSIEGNWDDAIANFERAVKTKPDYAEGFNALGIALQSQDRNDEAFAAFREAIRLKPEYADAHYRLATIYAKENKRDEAVESLRQAERLDPDHAAARHDLALIYLSEGNRSAALDEYAKLKTIDEKLATDLFNMIYNPAEESQIPAEAKSAEAGPAETQPVAEPTSVSQQAPEPKKQESPPPEVKPPAPRPEIADTH